MGSSRVLRFRITETDYLRLRNAARQDRLSISTMIRYAVGDWLAEGEETPPSLTSLCCSSLCGSPQCSCPTGPDRRR